VRRRPSVFDGIDTGTPVLVLGAQHYGCLGIIRSLGRLGIAVYAVDADPGRPEAHSRFLRDRFAADLVGLSPLATVDRLLEIGRQIGRPAVLIPTWDQMAVLVSEHQEALSEQFLVPRQPPTLAESLTDKRTMHDLAREHSVPTPDITVPRDIEEVRRFAREATFPVVLKGIDGNRLKRRTGRKMVIVENPADLPRLYQEMEDPSEPNLMFQEYIPGDESDVWMFNGYFDDRSACLAGFTGRKLRQWPAYTGVTSLGICLPNEVVRETTERWMRSLGYRGILDIEFRYDARDGQYKVLDVNPRIGATFRLFVARNGLDVVRALYLDLTGQTVPVAQQVDGRKWLVEGGDLESALTYRRDGTLTMRAWAASLKGVDETAYFARDDIVPFVRVAAGFVNRVIRDGLSSADIQPHAHQATVDRHFAMDKAYWTDIYERQTVDGLGYRRRRATALAWIGELGSPDMTRVLEVGGGAGLMSVDLAERGYSVTSIDTVAAMNEDTIRLARERGVAEHVRTVRADVHELPFDDVSFDLVVALGVLPWLHDPGQALSEMARVLRPNGYMLITADNALRLADWLDVYRNPGLRTMRDRAGQVFLPGRTGRSPSAGPVARRTLPRTLDADLARRGLSKIKSATIGYGPLTLGNRQVLSQRDSVRLHLMLQRLGDRSVVVIRDVGAHYVVLARKS
jgi:D-aspartate ligase